jgi:hypothetical protein
LFLGYEITESANLADGGAEQPLSSETSPGVLVPETKRRGFRCEKSLDPVSKRQD